MPSINFKYHTDKDYILVQFYDANQERIKPLDYMADLDNDTLTKAEAKWLRRLRNGLLFNIRQFNRKVDARNHIQELSLVESVRYLFNHNNVRNAKTGVKIKALTLNIR